MGTTSVSEILSREVTGGDEMAAAEGKADPKMALFRDGDPTGYGRKLPPNLIPQCRLGGRSGPFQPGMG